MTTSVGVRSERGTRVDWPWRFLALITSIPPHAWDALAPKGRVHATVVDRVGELVGRMPGSVPAHPAVLGARMLQGLAASTTGEHLVAEVQAWCETGWPRRWARPPADDHWDGPMVFAGAALAAARLAERHVRPDERAALADASHRLARAAVEA